MQGALPSLLAADYALALLNTLALDPGGAVAESWDVGSTVKTVTYLYSMWREAAAAWFFDWEKGGVPPPGDTEAGLDVELEFEDRPPPPKLQSVANSLLDVENVAQSPQVQSDIAALLSGYMFQTGNYPASQTLMRWSQDLKSAAFNAHY